MQNKLTGTYREITSNQKQTWSSGDFNEIARQNIIIAEKLCEAVNPHPGQDVLDVACGSGTAALVAARRYCNVTGIDYVPALIERAKNRAEASGLPSEFLVADAQELPFPDNSFDVIVSVYGVQFAPDQEKAASEMARVCRPGGKIGLAGPMPEGWSGDFFAAHAKYAPPPPAVKSPFRWGSEKGLNELLGKYAASIENKKQTVYQYYLSVDHAVEVFSTWFGPTLQALGKLNDSQKKNLLDDLRSVFSRYNRAKDGTAIIENTCLQSIITIKPEFDSKSVIG